MKILAAVLISIMLGTWASAQSKSQLPAKKAAAAKSTVVPKAKKGASTTPKVATVPKPVAAKRAESKTQNESSNIDKTPKAIFLIKRSKVDADIGEPVLYPFDRQISNLYYDLPNGVIRND